MRIATWNINSVRLRAPLLDLLDELAAPDVVCLQETKVTDELFPHDQLEARFPWRHACGMKGYNGVAILSKIPFATPGRRDLCARTDARHASVVLDGGVELHNFYVPAGGDVPDPDANDKFAHKLQFLDEMAAWWRDDADPKAKRVMVGDLNVAPHENDVWSHKQLLNVVSHTPVEVEKLGAVFEAGDWVDAVRAIVPESEKLYSWWSYRARDWRASDRGRRLDHVWVTPPLKGKVRDAQVLKDARDWTKASDHVPVVVDLDV